VEPRRKDFETGALKAFNFSKLLQRIPELKQLDCEIETISFENPIDSSNMNPAEWAKIATVIADNYHCLMVLWCFMDGYHVVFNISIEFYARELSKPTRNFAQGSQLPIGDLRTDAKENLITAIQIASFTKQ
jgi:L-asparaginase